MYFEIIGLIGCLYFLLNLLIHGKGTAPHMIHITEAFLTILLEGFISCRKEYVLTYE